MAKKRRATTAGSSVSTQTTLSEQSAWPVFAGDEDSLVVIYATDTSSLAKRFALHAKIGAVRLGREGDNDIVLEGLGISRHHARVEPRAGGWWVVDLDSRNGTFINYERIVEQRLARGDQLKIGGIIFKFLSGVDVEQRYHEEIYRLTIVDALTDGYNVRYLTDQLTREVARARRHDRPLAFVMIDFDHFKRVNDTLGHVAGDHVLREGAALIRAQLRRAEVFARYGGEEFALLLPETDLRGARALAERIRGVIGSHRFEFAGNPIELTASFGVAELSPACRRPRDLIAAADRKLYDAKHAGRDRVCG